MAEQDSTEPLEVSLGEGWNGSLREGEADSCVSIHSPLTVVFPLSQVCYSQAEPGTASL